MMIRVWLLLSALIGGVCLYRLATVGITFTGGSFPGYSASRIVMMAVLLVCIVTELAGAADEQGKVVRTIYNAGSNTLVKTLLPILFFALSLGWITGGFLSEERFHPTFERIQPLLLYAVYLCGSGSLLLFSLISSEPRETGDRADVRKLGLLYFLIACGLYLTIRITGVGIVPDEMDWQPTGMAIQYWEIFLTAWIALFAAVLLRLIHAYRRQRLTTVVLFFAIWIGSAVLWVSIPTMEVLNHSYFMEITPPNYLPYPASDCANYGLWAESILAGLGFKTTIAYRQFLITVIAFFEALTSRDLLKTIDCLTVVLALIPACMYLLGRRLHSHGAGIFAAGMAAMREYNTILLAPHYMVSNSKMWLSDLPAALCLLAVICAAVSWFQKPRSWRHLLLAGCLMGLSVTVRSQFIALIPFPAFFFLLRKGIPFRKRLLPALVFMLAAVFVIAPWFIRSKIITGDFILDEPGVHSTELARRWSDDVNNVVSRNPGESDAEYAARNKQHMIDFFKEKPLYVLKFTASHFAANQLVALTALPFGTDPSLTIRDVTNTDFHDVEGRMLKPENIPVLMVFVALIAFGMAAAWKRAVWAGLLPLFMCSLYLGTTSVSRYSGWRFALPGDWFYYFYFALGIAELGYQAAAALGEKQADLLSFLPLDTAYQHVYPKIIAVILVFFGILGAAPALCRILVPQQVFLHSTEENTREITEILREHPEKYARVEDLLTSPGKSVINGRMIYPRYFDAFGGLASGHPWIAYRSHNYPRLGFVLLNEENFDVILPAAVCPSFIPNASEAWVIGEKEEDGTFLADAVIIQNPKSNAAPRILTAEKEEYNP